jgi:hypothetical protein
LPPTKIKSNARENEKKRGKMSGTVNYPKVIEQLTDVIKELNVGFAPCGEAAPAAPSEEQRRADAVGLLKALLHVLEQGPTGAAAGSAEHGASDQGFGGLAFREAVLWYKNFRGTWKRQATRSVTERPRPQEYLWTPVPPGESIDYSRVVR